MVLIISLISSFEINKVNPFPAVTAPFPVIFLSSLFIAFKAKFLTYPGKLSLTKGKARSAITFLPKIMNYEEIHLME